MEPLLTLDYSNGSLPPPYAYTYKISFFETGYAQAEFFSSDNGDLTLLKSENKKFDSADFEKAFSEINTHTVINSELMIGGETMKMTFKKDGKNHEVIISPNDAVQKDAFNNFLKIYDPNFESTKNEIIENNNN